MTQGYDRETAIRFATLIGDNPIRDECERIVVLDAGEVLARLDSIQYLEEAFVMDDEVPSRRLVGEIESQGYDRKTATRYGYLIRDHLMKDKVGNILVINEGKIIAMLKPLKALED
jgi:hypothetical protein